jgi:hypothetical protein
MPLPHLDPDATAVGRSTGGLPVTTTTCIHETQAHLRRTGEPAAVVYRNGRPVGIVTAAALDRARSAHTDVPLTAVMDYVAVAVDAGTDVEAEATVHAFTRAAWDWLLHARTRG